MIVRSRSRSVVAPIATGFRNHDGDPKGPPTRRPRQMTTLEGRHPLIAIRTRGGKPASPLQVLLIAAATLGAAVAIAFAIHHSGGTRASQHPAGAGKHPPATQAHTTSLPAGARYDGGPAERPRGSMPVARQPLSPGVRYDGEPA